MNVELRHLRYFVAVAEAGNLSRAAAKLFIAQPPLSVQIRQLETELGAPLFVRHPKGVRLTAAGESLLPEARYLIDRMAHLKDAVSGNASSDHLRLGFVPSASSTVLPVLVRRLRTTHPALRIELREMISSEQAEALVTGQLDAAIVRAEPHHPRLVAAARMADPFCIALPQAEADGPAGAVGLGDFADRDFVAFTRHRGPAYFDQSIYLCARAGFSPRIRYEASTVHGVLDLVGAGLGVALVPSSCALLGVAGVRMRRLQGPAGGEVLVLLQRKADPNPVLPLLEDAVRTHFVELARRIGEALGQ